MGIKLSSIEEGECITLNIHTESQSFDLNAVVQKHIRENIMLISLDYNGPKRLVFDNVSVDIELSRENDIPIVWHNAKIISFKDSFVVQVPMDGVRHNRRNSFRVAIAKTAQLRMAGRGAQHVLIRDVSLTGFSIADRKKDLDFQVGNQLSVFFEDLGYKLNLSGHVVRIEEREDMIIYGLEITNLCNDLSPYINLKQRRNKARS